MARIAALFGGQGAQYPGMGKDFYDNFAQVRRIYECAGDIFGYDVAKTSFEGTPEELKKTEVAQSALYTMTAAAYSVARDFIGDAAATAGQSLGEYAALCCAGAYSVEDGMRILRARIHAMGKAVREVEGTMYAVIGKEAPVVEAACEAVAGRVWAVNYNLPTQTVIAGELEDTAKAAELLREQGAKVVRLDVDGAFHTPLMASAGPELAQAARENRCVPTRLDFYSNLTGGRLLIEDYADYLVRHMVSPVRMADQFRAMGEDGIDTCIEFGPKIVVALAKKNNRAFTALNIEDTASLKKAQEALGLA